MMLDTLEQLGAGFSVHDYAAGAKLLSEFSIGDRVQFKGSSHGKDWHKFRVGVCVGFDWDYYWRPVLDIEIAGGWVLRGVLASRSCVID